MACHIWNLGSSELFNWNKCKFVLNTSRSFSMPCTQCSGKHDYILTFYPNDTTGDKENQIAVSIKLDSNYISECISLNLDFSVKFTQGYSSADGSIWPPEFEKKDFICHLSSVEGPRYLQFAHPKTMFPLGTKDFYSGKHFEVVIVCTVSTCSYYLKII